MVWLERRNNWIKVALVSWLLFFMAGYGLGILQGASQAEAAQFAAAEKARIDSTTWAEVEQRRQMEIAEEKARQDSVNAAMAELKKKQEEGKLAAMAAAREKAMQDSISRAEANAARLADIARQKSTCRFYF